MKKEKAMLIDRYLAGEAPLHPERLVLPTDEELNETEIAFDQLMAERLQNTTPVRNARIISLWPWAAAACVLIIIGIGIILLWDKPSQPVRIVAKQKPAKTIVAPNAPSGNMPTPIEDHRDKPMNLAKIKRSVPKTPSREEERLDIPEIEVTDIQEINPTSEFPVPFPLTSRRDDLCRRIDESFPQTLN
jgi:hypothetical protein